MRFKTSLIACLIAFALVASMSVAALAAEKDNAVLKVDEASVVVMKMMGAEDMGVARELLGKAKAVAIFPGVFKAGFIVGGEGGTGIILSRTKDGWTAPAFYTLAGASVGLQIGASSTDFMMMIMTDQGLKGILKGNAKLGADASVAAGPVGRSASGSTTFSGWDSDIYSYSMSAGAFAGIALNGAGLEFDKERSQAYFGKSFTPAQILVENAAPKPASAKKLMMELEKFSK